MFWGQRDVGKNNQNLRESISSNFFFLSTHNFCFTILKSSCSCTQLKADRLLACFGIYRNFHLKSRHTGTDLGLICPIISLCDDPTQTSAGKETRTEGFSCSICNEFLAPSNTRTFQSGDYILFLTALSFKVTLTSLGAHFYIWPPQQ